MKLYTKKGDSGMTSLMNDVQVSKTDDRIELLGTIDELSSNIGLAKILVPEDVKKRIIFCSGKINYHYGRDCGST